MRHVSQCSVCARGECGVMTVASMCRRDVLRVWQYVKERRGIGYDTNVWLVVGLSKLVMVYM